MPMNRRLTISIANTNDIYKLFESRLSAFMAENGILVTRLTLGVIFLWFGILKFAPGLSAAEDLAKRTRCRSISAEMHSGFGPMRSALPMNLKGDFPNFKVWTRAQADIDRITGIWRECLDLYGGPYLLGERSVADAMYAPVVTRFLTYHVKLDEICGAYCQTIMAMSEMIEWTSAAKEEPENVEEREVEF